MPQIVGDGESSSHVAMRGRLGEHLTYWEAHTDNGLILSWIRDGMRLEWLDETGAPQPHAEKNHPSAFEHEDFVTTTISELLATKTVVELHHRPKVVAPLGVVPKHPNKLRLIWDGRYVNKHLVIPDLKYEGLGFLPEVLQLNDYMFTIDLKSGYHHLDIHPDFWEYLGFEWQGKYYCFTQLPFGLASACWAFSLLTKTALRAIREKLHVRCSGYLDDSIYAHQDPAALQVLKHQVLDMFKQFGFVVNLKKSQLDVSRAKKYLGMIVHTDANQFEVPADKRERLMEGIKAALSSPRQVHVRDLARVKGRLMSMSWAFGPMVKLFTKEMDKAILTAASWDSFVALHPECVHELEFWHGSYAIFHGRQQIWRDTSFDVLVHTDAAGKDRFSYGGWGGWHGQGDELQTARGRWGAEPAGRSSTWQELQAITLCLQSFNRYGELRGKNIQLNTDSFNAFLAIQKASVRVPANVQLIKQLFWYCYEHDIRLAAAWIPRAENQLADTLSKWVDKNDWRIHPDVFAMLTQRWGAFDIDLFASHTNHVVPKYFSQCHTPDTVGVNAFAFVWGRACWANPPFCLIGKVFQHAKRCGARVCMIAPRWPHAPWWHVLVPRRGQFSKFVTDFVWLPPAHGLSLPGSTGNERAVGVPKWGCFALLLDFQAPVKTPLYLPADA